MIGNVIRKIIGYESGRIAQFTRVSIKTYICYIITKAFVELVQKTYHYDRFFQTPRFLHSYEGIHPLTPPFIEDYYEDQYDRLKHKQLTLDFQKKLQISMIDNSYRMFQLWKDHPQRENPDFVDSGFIYCYYKILRNQRQLASGIEMEKNGVQVTNIIAYLRSLQQYRLQKMKNKVISQL